MNLKHVLKFCVILYAAPTAYWLLPASCYAAFDSGIPGARARAMNGANVAIACDVNGILGQPAALAGIVSPEMSVSYGRMYIGLADESEISDSVALFGMPAGQRIGVGAGYKSAKLNSIYSENTAVIAVGGSVGYGVKAGLAGKILTVSYGRDGYTDIDPVFANGMSKSAIDADIGIVLPATRNITLALARQNMLGADLGLAETAAVTGRDTLAVGYRENEFSCDIEEQRIGSCNRTILGIEKAFMEKMFALRLGIGWGEREYRNVSAGFGINFMQFAVDYSFEYPMAGIENTSGTHYLTVYARFLNVKPKRSMKENIASSVESLQPAEPVKPAEPALPAESMMPAEPALPAESMMPAEPALPAESTMPAGAPPVKPVVSMREDSLPAPAVTASKEVKDIPRAISPGPHFTTVPGKYTAIHKVVYGDTLPELSQKYYGTKTRWTDIYENNREKIEKGSLQSGQILIIP